jgi:rod shape determining protein RodA
MQDAWRHDYSLAGQWRLLPWGLIFLITLIAIVGFLALYSAGGGLQPYALKHAMRFGVGLIIMFAAAFVPLHWWRRLAWPIYVVSVLMLIFVDVKGHVGMGAQRWINLGFMKLQPSELMNIALVLALAAFYERREPYISSRPVQLIIPLLTIFVPVALVVIQPDLGTGLKLSAVGLCVMLLAGVGWWFFITGFVLAIPAGFVGWHFLRDYQKNRVLTFLNPESDPLGAGYHVTQSMIAFGSGGVGGKGYMQGSQSRLNFLPEKQTDFIFTLWNEEWGFVGGVFLLLLFAATIAYGYMLAGQARQPFARLVIIGLTLNISLYVIINTGMVMGLMPVVGIPLPLVSHGGTVMWSVLLAFGIILCGATYRERSGRYFG